MTEAIIEDVSIQPDGNEAQTSASEYVRMAEAMLADGDDERALQCFKQAAYLDKSNVDYRFKYIYALVREREYEEAERVCLEGATLYNPLPTYFHLMWLKMPSHTLDWGALIKRADELLSKYPAKKNTHFASLFILEKCIALRECACFEEARALLKAHWPLFAGAYQECSANETLYALQFAGLQEEALAYLECVAQKSNRAVLHGVRLGNAIMAVRRAIGNREWVRAHAPGVRILSLSQNCLPFVLSKRVGLNTSNTDYTCFDLSGMHGDTTAEMLATDFAPMKDRTQFSIQLLPGGIPMMRHKNGTVFAHERGRYLIGHDHERFHRELEKMIAAFRRASKSGQRLFLYSLVGAGNPNTLVKSLEPRFTEGNVRLLILDLKNTPTNVDFHPSVTYRHIPYPDDYQWNFVDHYTSDRGYEFECAITEAIREEMIGVQSPTRKSHGWWPKQVRDGLYRKFRRL